MTPMPSLLADYAEDYAFFPEDASTFSEANDWLFAFISWTSVAFFIPIAVCLFWFAWKYRKPKGSLAESNVAHNTPLEVAWSVFPSFFLVGMFVLGARHYLDQRTVPEGAYEVGVQAYKWGWTFDYGNGIQLPELHIVENEPVKLSMRSIDVIHSVYVPAFRAKKDVVPGRYNYMWFNPTKATPQIPESELQQIKDQLKSEEREWDQDAYHEFQVTKDGYRFYDLYCTEYCGTNHSQMQAMVVVHKTRKELAEWLEANKGRQPDQTQAAYGKQLYQNRGCSGCHSIDGSSRVGPSFLNLYASTHGLEGGEQVTVDDNYVRESILYPKAKIVKGYPAVMPSYKGQLSDDDIESIIAFLKEISDATPKEADGQTVANTGEVADQDAHEDESDH